MGIKIRYMVPEGSGTDFAYSVERRADGAMFDFASCVFRPLADIAPHAILAPLTYLGGIATDTFPYLTEGAGYPCTKKDSEYTFRIHNRGQGDKIVAELSWSDAAGTKGTLTSGGSAPVQPSYRKGKKYVGGKPIEARYRLRFYGDDGCTIHTATRWADDTSSCNCPRWAQQLPGKQRWCKHSERALTLTADVDETGEQPDRPTPAAPEPPRGFTPFRRRSRPVDT